MIDTFAPTLGQVLLRLRSTPSWKNWAHTALLGSTLTPWLHCGGAANRRLELRWAESACPPLTPRRSTHHLTPGNLFILASGCPGQQSRRRRFVVGCLSSTLPALVALIMENTE